MSLNENLTALVSAHGIDNVRRELDIVINTIINQYIDVLNKNGYRVEKMETPNESRASLKKSVEPTPATAPSPAPATAKPAAPAAPATKPPMKDILTVENVKQWLDEGHSYAWIAKEKVGCKQELISKFAKVNGLQKSKRQTTPDN
jgi:hypothetical protein